MAPVTVFFSYSHRDEKLRDKLALHLSLLQKQGVIQSWHDRKITAGMEWAQAIDDNLNTADIILLLISDNFLASDYCYDIEMQRAMERHEAKEALVVPIILKPVDWSGAPFGKLQAFPKDAKPVTKWSNRDEAFTNIAQGIRTVANTLRERPLTVSKTAPVTTKLQIHGWKHQASDQLPDVELDWTPYFNIDAKPQRQVADRQTWHTILLPQLQQVRDQLTGGRANLTLDIQGLLPLSAALIIGTVFQDAAGYTLQTTQRTVGNNQIWRSSTSPSSLKFKIIEEHGIPGDNLLMIMAISGSSWAEMQNFYTNSKPLFNAIIYAEPETGTGEQALQSDADAIALALHAKTLIQHYRAQYQANRTHLIFYTPMGFCLFLGSRLRLVGDVIPYERVANGIYQPSIELQTG